jgi:acid phosphatase (class A)
MRRLALALALLAAAPSCAGAGAERRPAAAAPSLDLAAVAAALPPPPAPGSDDAKADIAIVLWLQRTRSVADEERARRDVGLGLAAFAPALGDGFASASHPRTAALIDRAHAAATAPIRGAKARFGRVRPYDADRRVEPLDREDTPSYPSSHATRGLLVARILGELSVGRAGALLDAGRRVGHDRVLAGVHYPTDVLAGQRLGDALADALLADRAFRAELEAVRAAEWSARR